MHWLILRIIEQRHKLNSLSADLCNMVLLQLHLSRLSIFLTASNLKMKGQQMHFLYNPNDQFISNMPLYSKLHKSEPHFFNCNQAILVHYDTPWSLWTKLELKGNESIFIS